MIRNVWRGDEAQGLSPLQLLVYRSNLLGRDRTVCNWGGGNTSMKTTEVDFRGRLREVLWVKGSGSDLAAAGTGDFTPLFMDDVLPLLEREAMTDEEMVAYLSRCVTGPGHPRQSIETLLHAFLPFPHVDHTHPDVIIALACSARGPEIAREIFGDAAVWVPYLRPGFALSRLIGQAVRDNPQARLVIMEKHGLITWGQSAAESYEQTISVIRAAEAAMADRIAGKPAFGGMRLEPLQRGERARLMAGVLPAVRGALSAQQPAVLHFDDGADVLELVGSRSGHALSQVGAACPDHLVHTRRVPCWVDWSPAAGGEEGLRQAILAALEAYAGEYRTYLADYSNSGDPVGEALPRVILIPGLGMVTTGKDKRMATVAAELYHRAIAVMRMASALDQFVSLSPKEAYDVEFWPLELYKLSLAPPERALSRKVALVTGGAGGIGRAVVRQLAGEGAHIVVADLNLDVAEQVVAELEAEFGPGRGLAVRMDVTREDSVAQAFADTVLAFGGLDILVSNAGIASSSPLVATTLAEWQRNMDILVTGYFLVSRAAFQILAAQNRGGTITFVASKNALVAGKNAAAYSTAKAAELHLARCLAEEGGALGIRVNTVCPDAVLHGSQIWNSSWRNERAQAYGIRPEDLEAFYRDRTVLKTSVLPEDVAAAVAFLSGPRSAKTTGCILTVDGGVAGAYTR